MATVRKKIAELGTKHTPEGPVTITPARVKHWVKQHAAMKREGITVPLPWGHQLSAMPIERGNEAFLASRFNAGYVDGLEQDPLDGGLVAVIEAPGLKEENGALVGTATLATGNVVTTAIREVSPAVGGRWTDGKGKVWDDIVAHVALTTMPVWADQPGFQSLGTGKAEGFFYLGGGMADDKDDDKKKPDPEDEKELTESLMETPPENDGEEVPADMTQPTTGAPDEAQLRIDSIKANLLKLGVPLPEETNAENILEYLNVALTVLSGKQDLDAENEAAKPQPEPKPKPEEAPMPGMMLSTLRSNPVAAKIVANDIKRQRKEWLDRIESLKTRGLPVHEANLLSAAATQTRLSLLPTGDLSQPEVVRQIEILERVLPPADKFDLLSTARAGWMPTDGDDSEAEKDEATGLRLTPAQKKEIAVRSARVSGGAAKA